MDPRRSRALLVERNGSMRQVLAEALGDLGFEVREAAGRRQALELLLREADPGLLVVDLVDDAAGGEALLAFVSAHPELAAVPTIVMTDGTDPAHAPAHVATLVKPFGLDELRAAVASALGARAPAGEPPGAHH